MPPIQKLGALTSWWRPSLIVARASLRHLRCQPRPTLLIGLVPEMADGTICEIVAYGREGSNPSQVIRFDNIIAKNRGQ